MRIVGIDEIPGFGVENEHQPIEQYQRLFFQFVEARCVLGIDP